ncbi:hypothetical protein CKALI_03180 [Corynebacterium kalinowskii]|uniref:Uncharacterized protein n=1 Tax=Corynebacterium kalinowskii TaxID=2675216 RepID=A0A6B8VEN7_9CORY|nr:hypothetical protein [Corynebacterium kalinowskii]QGU01519.1 hypothetical protein CKALI_03180 [Corynebacterium kalinowskii]
MDERDYPASISQNNFRQPIKASEILVVFTVVALPLVQVRSR